MKVGTRRSPLGQPAATQRSDSGGSFAASVAVHVAVGALLVWLLSIPYPLRQLLSRHRADVTREEHLSYVEVRPSGGGAIPAPRQGGDGRPIDHKHAPPKPLVAPTEIPKEIPAPPPNQNQPTTSDQGSGPVVGAGGAAEGVVPEYDGDPRLWGGAGPPIVGGSNLSSAERLDSSLSARIAAHNDSIMAMSGGRHPGDWTFEKGGKRYGADQQWIYFGKFKIPTALLALLPLNGVGNPTVASRNSQLDYMHNDIQYEAQRSLNEDEFRDAVKRIRERKEREHEAKVEEQKKKKKPPQPVEQNVTTAP